MKNDLPISPKKKFKYSITFQSFDEETFLEGDYLDNGFEVEDDKDTIGEILYKANTTYGIYMPVSFGTWESTEPLENRDFFEKGIRKYFALHLTNEDGTEISQEENDFISYLLSDGRYEIDKFRDYAVGGIVLGAVALGVGALITYFYFKDKKVGNNKKELVSKTAKSVTYRINGKDRKFPIKDAWKKEHSSENKSENYEVPQEDRFKMGGEIIFFDRHASMDESTRDELTEMTNYPYIKEYDVEENGEKKYDRIESELKKEGVSVKTIDNYLSGLYDGYNYSNTEGFKKEMAKLKLVDNNFYNKIMEMYDKVSKYPKIDKKFADGGDIKGNKIPENSKIRINYVSVSVYKDSYEEGETENVNNYNLNYIDGNLVSPKELVNFLSKEIYTSEDSSDYVILDNNIHTSQLQDADGSKASKSEIEEWKKGNLELYSANFVISVSIISEIEFNEQKLSSLTGIGIYKEGGEAGRKSVKKPIRKKRQPKVARTQFEEETYEYKKGGFVSKGELVWKKLSSAEKMKFLSENFTPQITPRSQETLVGKAYNFLPKEVKITLQSKYANVEEYADGGSTDLDYSNILNVLKSKIDEAIKEIPNEYENSSSVTSEEIEHESRDGFIPYTDGGYQAIWFEYISTMFGTGYSLPTKQLDDEMNRQINYNLKLAKESFIENYPEIVEELGEENIDYNSLYEAGYGEEAEELSNDESEMMSDDTIMMRIFANYYNPENSRAKDNKHTIRLFGDVNLESPYHRTGNLDDSYEYEFTFDSIGELEKEMNKGLKQVISWFEGDMYNDSNTELKVRRMADGGEVTKAEEIKNKMYKSFESYLNNKISDEQLVSKLERILGKRRWFRFFQGDTSASDFNSIKRSLSESKNREYEKEKMQISLDTKGLQIYNYNGDEIFEDGGSLKNLKNIAKKYLENEDDNNHSENVVLLATHFGTKEDLKKAKEILALHNSTGSLTSENGKARQQLHLKLISKARKEMSKEGVEFENGGSIDLSTKEKAVMYSWVDKFLEKYSGDDNLSQSLDMYDEFSKKFNKSKEQTHDIIDSGWAKSRGYADGGEFEDGGEVQDWMEQALTSLIEETGNEGLDITMVSNDGNEFFAGNDMEDYHVFKTEDDAQNRAVEEVRQYLEDSPENFSQDWLKNYINGRDFFEEQLNDMNRIYAEDIASESDSKYANRLIAEMVENGIIDEDDALLGDSELLADYNMQDFVNVMTESQLDEGNDGLDYFISNFGEEETYKMAIKNNLIDIDEASKDAVNIDGIGHFLSSYDGETLYLSNDCVAYRTN